MLGLYFADAGQHLEHRLFVDHNAPHTRSNVDYKGALQGQGAHAVWIGNVLIRKVAEGIETYEENRNLVLTDGCQADSVPNLEIETGEIEGAGPRVRDRPLRRRAAVLPALARDRGGRGAPPGRARLLQRHDPQDRRARARGAAGQHRRGRAGEERPRQASAAMTLPARLRRSRELADSTPLRGRGRRPRRGGRARTATRSSRSRTSAATPRSRCPRATSTAAPSSAGCTARASTCAPASPPARRPPSRSPSTPCRSTATTY